MKSRLAVSVLFTLVATSFLPNATVAIGKLRLRADKVFGCLAGQMSGRLRCGQKRSALNGPAVMQTYSPDRVSMNLDCLHPQNFPGSHDKNLEFLATASRIREVLDRIHIR